MKRRILVVDDTLAIRMFACFILQKAGYEVVEMDTATLALVYLKENIIDLIITDMNMPELSGIDLIAEVRSSEQHAAVPVIGISAADHAAEFVAAGAHSFVDKMNIDTRLVSAVNELLKAA